MIKNGILLGALAMTLIPGCAHHEGMHDARQASVGGMASKGQTLLFPPITKALPPQDFQRLMRETLQARTYNICSPTSGGGNPRTCPVEIEVAFEGGKCVPKADDLKVPPGVRIIWQVRGGGWEFAANGVEFKDAGASAAFDGHSNASGSVFFWDVLPNPRGGKYDYSIHLKEQHGSRTCDFDPSIWI